MTVQPLTPAPPLYPQKNDSVMWGTYTATVTDTFSDVVWVSWSDSNPKMRPTTFHWNELTWLTDSKCWCPHPALPTTPVATA